MRALRIALGALVTVAGVVLVFSPMLIADTFHRPTDTHSQLINLRATWGGTLMGLGLFILARNQLRPWAVTVATLLLCAMAGIGAARAVGFVLDGQPDTLQWVWLVAEIVLVVASGAYLVRRRSLKPVEKRQ